MTKPRLHTLKNGMKTILIPQKGSASMTIFVMVKVGSRYETREINGVSHFIEHLMFKGTKKRPNTEILSRTLDQYGAEYNAFTGKDMTAYYIKMDAEKTPLAIDMLHDMLFHSKYDPVEIDRERGVILEEINMYEDNPRRHLGDILDEVFFPNSTLGWNIAGPRKVIQAVTRDQIIAYRDAYYIPERMTVVVAGKIIPDLLPLLNRTFGSVRSPKHRQDMEFTVYQPPDRLVDVLALQNKKTEQVQLGLSFYGIPMNDPDVPAATLLATMLGGSMSSRLFIQIRERLGLCYSIGADHECLQDVGVFSIRAGLDKKRMAEATSAIFKEIDKISHTRVTNDELRRAKDHIRGRNTLAFEDSATQADWYGRQWLFQHKLETMEEKIAKIEKVRPEQVQSVAKRIFRADRMASAVIGPFSKKIECQAMLKWSHHV